MTSSQSLSGRVDMRFQTNQTAAGEVAMPERGASAVPILVILVPVLFGLLGFALDLGIMYSTKGDLKTGAEAMALAAAQQLIGTDAATTAAAGAAQATIVTTSGLGNRYYFHGFPIGQTTGTLASTVFNPGYYATAVDAIASDASGDGSVASAQAKYVRMTVTGQLQLLFWSFLPTVSNRNITVLATAVAGVSAPLCIACGIEPYAVAAIDASDTTDFGFVLNNEYSFTYLCTGLPTPPLLASGSLELNYVMLNRLDPNAVVFPDETSQAFRDLAGGMPGSTNGAIACFTINNTEVIWASAAVSSCSATAVAPTVTDALCGLDTRLESVTQEVCQSVVGIDTLSTIYQPDTDINVYDVYTSYTGNGRRILTIPIVDALSATGSMTVIGFRQFLLNAVSPSDPNGRFLAIYIGSVAPVRQGRFDGCQQTAGPGKVVLHQ